MPAENHKTRRALLRLFGAAPALAILPAAPLAASPRGSDADGEILALSSEVLGRCAAADQFMSERIWPFDGQFEHLVHDDPRPAEERIEAAFAYSVETGRDAAIGELADFEEETDRIFRRMMAIPATTQPGRAGRCGRCSHTPCAITGTGQPSSLTGTMKWRAPCWASSRWV